MFATADLVLLTKTDLLPYVPFDADRFTAAVRAVNSRARVLPVCATSGQGLEDWYSVLRARRPVHSPMEQASST
jgi:hydrogenase nickel incorporation protein HypB